MLPGILWGDKMPCHHQFGLFAQHKTGPLWKAFFTDLDEAKRYAQQLANRDGFEYFVFNFVELTEVARAFPLNGPQIRPPRAA